MSVTNDGNTDIINEPAAAFACNNLLTDVTNDVNIVNQSASSLAHCTVITDSPLCTDILLTVKAVARFANKP